MIKSLLLLIEWKMINKSFSYLNYDLVTVVKLLGN